MIYYNRRNCIVNISNSILKHFNIPTYHETHKELDTILEKNKDKKVCICLFDGMGKYIEKLHEEYIPYIINHNKFTITSVFPPTTVAATTSLLSSKYPCETGWLGWTQKFPDHLNPIIMFFSEDDVTQEAYVPNTWETYKYENVIDRIVKSGKKADEIKSFLLKDASMNSFFNIMDGKLVKNDFLYAYNTEPDTSLHELGTEDQRVSNIMKTIDDNMKKIVKKHPETLFIVLADHGHIDTKYFLLNEHEDFKNCLEFDSVYLDSRTHAFYVKPEKKKDFTKLFEKYYGKYFNLYTKKQVLDLKIFGEGKPNKDFEYFIGDFLAISNSEYGIANSIDHTKLKSNHAGGTAKERFVNVAIFNAN